MKYILYVEDDRIDQLAFQRMIRNVGEISCMIVNYIAEAREAIKDRHFDLIITDYHLNDGTAKDIIAYARDIPVVVVTGTLRTEERGNLAEAGVMEYLSKPIQFPELANILQKVNMIDSHG